MSKYRQYKKVLLFLPAMENPGNDINQQTIVFIIWALWVNYELLRLMN